MSSFAAPAARSVTMVPRVPVPDRGSDPEEHRIAERLRSGDPDALRDAYDRYGRATFGLLLRVLGDRALAEDVQQQVFLEVWQRAGSYDPARSGLLTWIMMIARSRAVDQLRRRIPEPRDPTGETGVLGAEASVEAEVDALAERWYVAALLRRLPEPEADVLRQRFYGGLSQSEIAERGGIALGTVKSRMVSGLRRLRAMLDEEGVR
ncbi:RNA polymerase sigma factor [Capillimicrobium parvum]|uniref:ECF RNA polymerase sigma factor SigK n=1 Tax=Capillimicrobium parvum TaxID=2884022 RepID=A0A9E6XVY9_9ACTN|nr:sigma-70 family RNA polymerase sigma factor [Capillimicrobium parvum]UGS35426.1 ECF RNA polymerase sigma factor SigK [Capillimicrobium parvum]